jgi:hypothetical protein
MPTRDPAKKRAQRARYEARHPERRGRLERFTASPSPSPRGLAWGSHRAPAVPRPRATPDPEPAEPSLGQHALGAFNGFLRDATREVNRGSFAGDVEIARRKAEKARADERERERFHAERAARAEAVVRARQAAQIAAGEAEEVEPCELLGEAP